MTIDAPTRPGSADEGGTDASYRYPGSAPFSDRPLDRRLFKGRARESETVLHSILSSDIVLLYGASGLGKSSLLNAGVMSELRAEGYWPVSVRVNDTDTTLVESIREQIVAGAEKDGEIDLVLDRLDTPGAEGKRSLWALLASLEVWRDGQLQQPILILDQFEELFTLGRDDAERERFIAEFGEVVRGHRRREAARSGPALPPPRVKFVLVIREDSLGQLEALATHVPQIMRHRFRVEPLDRGQATRAILEPAGVTDEQLDTQPFEYTEGAAEEILDFLQSSARTGGERGSIEPSQLQILCQYVEREIVPRKAAGAPPDQVVTIERDDLEGRQGLDRILSEFYRRTVESCPADERDAVRELCERGLISDDEHRLSLEEGQIGIHYGVEVPLLKSLVDKRLLRADARVGSVYYELSHDTLVPAILADREARLARQRQEEQARLARKRQQRGRVLAVAAGAVAVVAIIAAIVFASGDSASAPDVALEEAPPDQLSIGEPVEETIGGPDASAVRFAVAALPDQPVEVVVAPDEQLDVLVEVSDGSGIPRQQNQLGNGGTERIVLPPATATGSVPEYVVQVTGTSESEASFVVSADELTPDPLVRGDPVDAAIGAPGAAAVFTVESSPGDELLIEVGPHVTAADTDAGSDKATLDATIEVVGPPGTEVRPIVDAGGPGVAERATIAAEGTTLVVVRGKTTVGGFAIVADDKSREIRPGESVAGTIDTVGSDSEFSFEAEPGSVYAVRVRPDSQLDVVLDHPDAAGESVTTDAVPQGQSELALVASDGGRVGLTVRGFESSIGTFDIEVSSPSALLEPDVPVARSELGMFDIEMSGDDAGILTVGPTATDGQLDLILYAPDGSVVASIEGTATEQQLELGSRAGRHRLVVGSSAAAGEASAVGYEVELASERGYAAGFGALLDEIAVLESRTERYNSELEELNAAVFGDGFAIDLGPDFEAGLLTYQTGHRELARQFDDDMRALVATLEAQPLENTPFGELDLEPVRDAALDHYRAWLEYVPQFQLAIENWAFDALRGATSDGLPVYSRAQVDPFRQAVDETFFGLCSALSAEQPSSGRFSQVIADDCTD